jgi:hypothetical protein
MTPEKFLESEIDTARLFGRYKTPRNARLIAYNHNSKTVRTKLGQCVGGTRQKLDRQRITHEVLIANQSSVAVTEDCL